MTRQTEQPIERLHLENTYRPARELVNLMRDGLMTTDLPYQRGDVWTLGQRIDLIRSWLSGTPIPSIIINDRYTNSWTVLNGAVVDEPGYAVIDGKQRLETARMWYDSELAVPASWFKASEVLITEDTGDGPYVRYSGLSTAQQYRLSNVALFPFAAAKVATIEEEAAIYGRVNGGGTPQTADDMAHAARIAGR